MSPSLSQIELRRDNLFSYLLFLRISPLLPNWFINIASPILSVPFPHFFFATLIGVSLWCCLVMPAAGEGEQG